MKKILFILFAFCPFLLSAQDIQLMVGKESKVFVEKTIIKQNSLSFFYLESTYKGASMMKVFHEQKFWEAPLFIHTEYQTTFNEHTALLGLSYSFNLPVGYISLTPLCRYDTLGGSLSSQISSSYLIAWSWGDINGYNHCWYNNGVCFFGEERLNINLTETIAISGILDITHFGGWSFTPFVGLRIRV